MVKLIVGKKGSGKTKKLISMVNEASEATKGYVVCIEKGKGMRFDISTQVKLIDIDDYNINGFDSFYGFIAGVFAGNYDVTDLFIDQTFKIGGKNTEAFANMIDRLTMLQKNVNANICFTVSCDPTELPERLLANVVDI